MGNKGNAAQYFMVFFFNWKRGNKGHRGHKWTQGTHGTQETQGDTRRQGDTRGHRTKGTNIVFDLSFT